MKCPCCGKTVPDECRAYTTPGVMETTCIQCAAMLAEAITKDMQRDETSPPPIRFDVIEQRGR